MGRALTGDQLDALLRRLGPDAETAGRRYVQLRHRLLTIFRYRGCANADELVDEAIDRLARKLLEGSPALEAADPTRFVVGIAWNIAREFFKRTRTVPLPDGWDQMQRDEAADTEWDERGHACLERCLVRLARDERDLILSYYQEDKQARITHRQMLAERLRVSANSLRIRVHRITVRLRQCVFDCLNLRETGVGAA